LNSCDKIDGCDVEYYDTEKEVLTKWKELMNNLNSDIITGYNIFGFDMEYIWQRATELNILEDFSITQLIVVDNDQYKGILHLHDILKEGII
jgi:DNA polymerase elongation subunit (family B)